MRKNPRGLRNQIVGIVGRAIAEERRATPGIANPVDARAALGRRILSNMGILESFMRFVRRHFRVEDVRRLTPDHFSAYVRCWNTSSDAIARLTGLRDALVALSTLLGETKTYASLPPASDPGRIGPPRPGIPAELPATASDGRDLVARVRDWMSEFCRDHPDALPPLGEEVLEDFARCVQTQSSGRRRIEDLTSGDFERYLTIRMKRSDPVATLRMVEKTLSLFAQGTNRAALFAAAMEPLTKLVRVTRRGACWIAEPYAPSGESGPARAGFLRHGASPCAPSCRACSSEVHRGQWWTDDPAVAERVPCRPDPRTHYLLSEEAREKKRRSLELSKAESAPIELPAPPGEAYRPFQKAGIAYALSRRATLNADEMGLGKTIQALGVVNADATLEKILIVCPSTLRLTWVREAGKWLVRKRTIHVVEDNTPPPSEAEIVVVSSDRLAGPLHPVLMALSFDLLIADEAHYFKNPGALRTKALLGAAATPGIVSRARKILFLTGTPILNRLDELYVLVSALDPWVLGTRKEFEANWTSPERRGALSTRLRETVMVRRLKQDVAPDLPPKTHAVRILPREVALEKAVAEEREVLVRSAAEVRAIVEEVAASAGDPEGFKAAAQRLREAKIKAQGHLFAARRRVAVAKVPAVVDRIGEYFDEGVEKLVVWAHHREVVDALGRAFGAAAVTLDGETPSGARLAAQDRFQEDRGCRLFIGSMKTAGHGLTLTAAAHVIFAELDWSPSTLTQAEDRCHRIGQRHPLLIEHHVVAGSVDARLVDLLIQKQKIIQDVLDVVPEEFRENERWSALEAALALGLEAA